MRGMMQGIAVAIKELPDFQIVAHPARPPGLQSVQKPGIFPDLNLIQKAEAGDYIEKEQFKTLYDAVYVGTSTPKFAGTHGELVMMFHEDLEDMDDDENSEQQEIDNWRIY